MTEREDELAWRRDVREQVCFGCAVVAVVGCVGTIAVVAKKRRK